MREACNVLEELGLHDGERERGVGWGYCDCAIGNEEKSERWKTQYKDEVCNFKKK